MGITPEEILGFDASVIFNKQGDEANKIIYSQTEVNVYEKLLQEKDLRIKNLEEENLSKNVRINALVEQINTLMSKLK